MVKKVFILMWVVAGAVLLAGGCAKQPGQPGEREDRRGHLDAEQSVVRRAQGCSQGPR